MNAQLPKLLALLLALPLASVTVAGCTDSTHARSSSANDDDATDISFSVDLERDLAPDAPTPDADADADADPDDAESDTDAPDPARLACPLRFEECLMPFTGCWYGDCEDFDDCSIAGCGVDAPELRHIVWGSDWCDEVTVELLDSEGRLRAADVGAGASPYESVHFTTLLDGEAATTCEFTGLPTGANRYKLQFRDLDRESAYAAVLEVGYDCPPCPDVAGCYRVESDGEPPLLNEEHVALAMRGDCWVDLTPATNPPGSSAWVSRSGVLTLSSFPGGDPPIVCSLEANGTGFGPAVCRRGPFDEQAVDNVEIYLTRADESDCE